MSREILFRGKHIHTLPGNEHLNGRWIEGYLSDENHINSPELAGEFQIDPETVCQYTGLTDKNGRKIFEGDIVKHYNDTAHQEKFDVGAILWDKKDCGFCRNTNECDDFLCIDRDCVYEVIGNIFDNPELLEG